MPGANGTGIYRPKPVVISPIVGANGTGIYRPKPTVITTVDTVEVTRALPMMRKRELPMMTTVGN